MPATFSHPLAVAPLRRFCPRYFNFSALVIGSMSPDFGYFVREFSVASFAHTVPGTLVVCLPAGLAVLLAFYGLRRSLCFVLPQPHRGALMPLAVVRPEFTLRSVLVAVISILLGAWSHTIWDSFTHTGAWTERHITLLQQPVIHVGGTPLPVSYLLQQLSTFGGAAILAVCYVRWLRRQSDARGQAEDLSSDRWRYLLLIGTGVVALAIAAPLAFALADDFEGYTAVRVFVFRTAVYSIAVFMPLLTVASLVSYLGHRRKHV